MPTPTKAPTTPRRPRTPRTAKERAQAALGVAQRLHDAAKKRRDDAQKALETADVELRELAARLEHRKADPDLRDDPTLHLGGEDE